MKYLIVVAHPDDEVLGAGGSIYHWTKKGNDVYVCILCSYAKERTKRPNDLTLLSNINEANKILGVRKVFEMDFPNLQMNTVPHIDVVKEIEKVIEEVQPDYLITHHPSDVNDDHVQVSRACQAAFRIFQRKTYIKPLKCFAFMEILSSTDWNVNCNSLSFKPNWFIELLKEGLDVKIEALSKYKDIMRTYPHPRSIESLTGLAAYRGSQSGLNYAESFELVFVREE